MLAILTMLFTLLEVVFALWAILNIMKARKIILTINEEAKATKKEVINTFSDYRISLRTLNKQTNNIKDEQKTKQVFELINTLGTISLFFSLKKKKSL